MGAVFVIGDDEAVEAAFAFAALMQNQRKREPETPQPSAPRQIMTEAPGAPTARIINLDRYRKTHGL